ncbi:MAG: hypothetical protein ACTSWE_15215 [Promethearchaeota archaeon]
MQSKQGIKGGSLKKGKQRTDAWKLRSLPSNNKCTGRPGGVKGEG